MTQDKAPEWAEKEATVLDHEIATGILKPGFSASRAIALALSQAYERGQESMRERAAEVLDTRARMAAQVSHPAAVGLLIALPDAIRSLPIEQGDGE